MIVMLITSSSILIILILLLMLNGQLSLNMGIASIMAAAGIVTLVVRSQSHKSRGLTVEQKAYLRMFSMGISLFLVGTVLCIISYHKEGLTTYSSLLAVMASVGCAITIDGTSGFYHVIKLKHDAKTRAEEAAPPNNKKYAARVGQTMSSTRAAIRKKSADILCEEACGLMSNGEYESAAVLLRYAARFGSNVAMVNLRDYYLDNERPFLSAYYRFRVFLNSLTNRSI